MGDINADGFADIIIGAIASRGLSNAVVETGEVYVVFGKEICACLHMHTFVHVWRSLQLSAVETDTRKPHECICRFW